MLSVFKKIPKTELLVVAALLIFFCSGAWSFVYLALLYCLIKDLAIPSRPVPGASHDNNFNLLRIILAWGVILQHSYDLSRTPTDSWFAHHIASISGRYAVNIFFFVSGYLVSKSLLRRHRIRDFITARALRLIPALAVVVTLSVFVLGPCFTALPLSSYFSERDTWDYLYKNILLIRTEYSLPGVFQDNPYTSHVNGSLWSLRYEVSLYAFLAVISLIGLFSRPKLFYGFLTLFFAWYFLVVLKVFDWDVRDSLLRTSLYFYLGCLALTLEEKFTLRFSFVVLSAIVSILCWHTFFHPLTLAITLCSSTLFLALFQNNVLLMYNKLGDYSYGTYLLGGPVLQTLLSLEPGISHTSLLLSATIIAIALAALSWHFVEKPCLALTRRM